jgi:hypothetical protein
MRVRVVFVFLSVAFAFASLGAAITTTKSVEMKQAAKGRPPLTRPAG